MDRREIVDFWERRLGLFRWPAKVIDQLVLPEASKSFLLDVGMPLVVDWAYRLEWQSDIPLLPGRAGVRHLAQQYDRSLVVDENLGGSMHWDESQSGVRTYVNASVEQFAECQTEWQRLADLAIPLDTEAGRRAAASFEQRIRQIDPAAFEDTENPWSVAIEEMGYVIQGSVMH